jgi:M6 family metalloprotease-like protein
LDLGICLPILQRFDNQQGLVIMFIKTLCIALITACMLPGTIAHAQRSNCASYPEQITLTQPDGSKLQAYMRGSEMLHYFETTDGYTVLQNPSHAGAYEFAKLDEKGDLVASGIKADGSFRKNMPAEKGISYSAKQVADARKAFYAKAQPLHFSKSANGQFPSKGTKKLLVVLMQFKDEPAVFMRQSFVDLLTQDGYNVNNGTGSFREFYADNSFGQFDLDITVVGWYTASRNKLEYGQKDLQGNYNPSYNSNVQELVGQAVDSAKITGGVDFSQYDNNGDGELDGLVIFHSGYGAEQGRNGYIWSHRWSLWGGSDRYYDGVHISNYCINPAKRDFGNGLTQVRIGVVTHEFGHILGLPDLYDTDNNSEGAGNWCLMAGGPWMNSERTPCQMNAWCKSELGWLTPTVISGKGQHSIGNSTDNNIAYRINTPDPMEYFLLENRQLKRWDRFLAGKGLAIWHINLNRADNFSMFGSNDVNTDTSMYGVGIKQADGLRHLERRINRGDGGDLFPGSSGNTSFTPVSNPSSLLHATNVNGERMNSNVYITEITQDIDSSMVFSLGGKPTASFVPSVKAGCAPLTTAFDNQSVFSGGYLWDFGNGITSTKTNPVQTYTEPGTYNVSLIVYDDGEPADTFNTTIKVSASPKASYTLERDSTRLKFTNTSTGADYYQWRFNSNMTSTSPNPTVNIAGPVSFFMVAFNISGCTDTVFGQLWPTGVQDLLENTIGLSAFPNPFSETTTLSYMLESDEDVTITVHNLLGEVVYSNIIPKQVRGKHDFQLNGGAIPSAGIYLVRIASGTRSGLSRIIKQ